MRNLHLAAGFMSFNEFHVYMFVMKSLVPICAQTFFNIVNMRSIQSTHNQHRITPHPCPRLSLIQQKLGCQCCRHHVCYLHCVGDHCGWYSPIVASLLHFNFFKCEKTKQKNIEAMFVKFWCVQLSLREDKQKSSGPMKSQNLILPTCENHSVIEWFNDQACAGSLNILKWTNVAWRKHLSRLANC